MAILLATLLSFVNFLTTPVLAVTTAATSTTYTVTLQNLVAVCAPRVAPRTALAIVDVESSGYPWAIGDNTTRRSYHPGSYVDAVELAKSLLAKGDNIDAGLMQVNSDNWPTYSLTPETVFDPCTNVNAGAAILRRAYQAALARFKPGPEALYHAFEIYNSGHAYGVERYANVVWKAGLSL